MSDVATIHVLTVSPDGSEPARGNYTSTGTGWLTDGSHRRRLVSFKIPPIGGHQTSYARARALAKQLIKDGEVEVEIPTYFLTYVGEPGTGY